MHQLKVLIWKSYKVRLRSPYSTALDLLGPLVIIFFYILVKIIIDQNYDLALDEQARSVKYFRGVSSRPLDVKKDLRRFMCPKMLFHSTDGIGSTPIRQAMEAVCGLELEETSSRRELVDRLQSDLDARVAFKQAGANLEGLNSSDSCIKLPARDTIHETGLVLSGGNSIEMHLMNSAGSSMINMPYSQGSTYNEYKLPISDLNTGAHLLELCVGLAFESLADTKSRLEQARPSTTKKLDIKDIKWRVRPYPINTGIFVVPITTTVAIMMAYLCSNVATVIRVSEANEYDLHRYIRLAGLPTCHYWISMLVVMSAQAIIQSLISTIILEIPTGSYIYDPITDASMTLRWMLIFAYSFTSNAHAIFMASLFDRSTQALLALCLLGSAYAMYPILLILQWSPYGFTLFWPVNWLALFNPAAGFNVMCLVLMSVALQTGEPFTWQHLGLCTIGGGFTTLSTGQLLALLILQGLIFILLTIAIDQWRFCAANTFLGYLFATINELCCSNCCCPASNGHLTEDVKTKSLAVAKSTLDPNRICCSLRHVSVRGPTIMVPHTKGNPLRFKDEQLGALRVQVGDKTVSKIAQYLVNRKLPQGIGSTSKPLEEPILIDETIRQHIIWVETHTKFEDLELNFRFNQISYVLGPTDSKELLFASMLGLAPLERGCIIIDGNKYTEATMNLARQQIGYLTEKNVFYHELSIFENLQFFGSLRQSNYKSFDSESLFILNLLHLSGRREHLPASLTTRSARKLALAVASVGYTKLLLLTEPTLNLNWRNRNQVQNLLRKYKSIRSIVIDSSDVDEAVAYGDQLVLLKNVGAELSDTPERLAKRLNCGYWIAFEPAHGDGRTVNFEALKGLEQLTQSLFQADKLDTGTFKRSIYTGRVISSTGKAAEACKSERAHGSCSAQASVMSMEKRDWEDLYRMLVIVKIRHTKHSTRGLCVLLRMFAHHSSVVQDFKLAYISYESLEDVLVSRISRAIYPELPPDLLLSLQHRTLIQQRTPEQPPSVSVRKIDSKRRHLSHRRPIHSANLATIIKDRLSTKREALLTALASLGALLVMALALVALQNSFGPADGPGRSSAPAGRGPSGSKNSSALAELGEANKGSEGGNYYRLAHSELERLYKYRIGFYSLVNGTGNESQWPDGLELWPGNRELVGKLQLEGSMSNRSEAEMIADILHKTKDLAASLIAFDSRTNEATIIFEPHLPHMMFTTIKTFINFNLFRDKPRKRRQTKFTQSSAMKNNESMVDFASAVPMNDANAMSPNNRAQLDVTGVYTTSRRYCHQPWHESIRGFMSRRMIYGIGIAIAESMVLGVTVLAPIRHRMESHRAQVRVRYWFGMALVDLTNSLLLITGYILLFCVLEGLGSAQLISAMFIVLLIYKLASLPIPYMVSIATESQFYGFAFIFLLHFSISWNFAIFLKSFVDWTLLVDSYLYTISNWLLFGIPITALIEAMTVIGQVNNISRRCADVPAYTKTTNTIGLDGIHRHTIIDDLLAKVRECLTNGKMSIETGVLHQQSLGVLWSIYLILLFGLVGWTFLLTCERFYGIIARQFSSARMSTDPMKTIVRLPDNTTSLFKWDKERDRLISEYIKCMNELKYVKSMAANCLILRIWLKPLSDQASLDKHLSNVLEPIMALGHTKNDIQIELRTTLQLFIRIGDENRHCRVDKVHLIETYSKYMESHSDTVAKFAVVDWTRENLYKILLHGHYNTKITSLA